MLLFTSWLSSRFALGFTVSGFWAAFWAGFLISLVSLFLSIVVGEKDVQVSKR